MKIELNVEAVVTMHVMCMWMRKRKLLVGPNTQAHMCVQVHLWVFNMDTCRRKIYHFITSTYLSTKVAARKAFPGKVFLSFCMMEFCRIIGFMFQPSQFLLNLTARVSIKSNPSILLFCIYKYLISPCPLRTTARFLAPRTGGK